MRKQKGTTLLELMTTVGIMSVLASVGVPGLSTYIQKHQIHTEATTIRAMVYTARKMSINSGQRAVFCGVNAEGLCSRDNIIGWAVFLDSDRSHSLSEADTMSAFSDSDIQQHAKLRASNQSYITFNVDGSARQFGSIYVCGNRLGENGKRISVNRAGRPYIALDSRSNRKKIKSICGKS